MATKYTVSVLTPPRVELKPFNWKAYNKATAEINAIISNALARNFRKIQSANIEILLMNGICPKCKGTLTASEDGATCFTCGLVVYRDNSLM